MGRRPRQPALPGKVETLKRMRPCGVTNRERVGPPVKRRVFLFSSSTVSPGLIQAYYETHYTAPSLDLTLVVDQPNPALGLAHRRYRSDCSAFITACNPYSAKLTMVENETRPQNLASELRSRSLGFVDGIGQHPSNDWSGEPSSCPCYYAPSDA
jgi:hypothetical protein